MTIEELKQEQCLKFEKVSKYLPTTPKGFASNLGKAYSKGFDDGIRYQKKIDIVKAWDWILVHTNAMPGDVGDFIKTMEEDV